MDSFEGKQIQLLEIAVNVYQIRKYFGRFELGF